MATTNATAPKGAPKKQSQGFTGIKSGFTVIILCCIIAVCIRFCQQLQGRHRCSICLHV